MKKENILTRFICFILVLNMFTVFAAGCTVKTATDGETSPLSVNAGNLDDDYNWVDIIPQGMPLSVFNIETYVPSPEASGTLVESNEKALIDYSHMAEGYVMIKYLTAADTDLKIKLLTPTGLELGFNLRRDAGYDVFPLTDGNGTYSINVCYNVPDSDRYALALNLTVNVELADEFGPFLRPSTYVYYKADSPWILKAKELVGAETDMLEVVTRIFNFVIEHVTYDYDWATRVKANDPTIDYYAPVNISEVYTSGTGVCSGYAALMTSMLRSNNIPTRYVVGMTSRGELHAWINTYSEATGWVDGIVYFDGTGWKLMDPTFASQGGETGMKYSENASNYQVYYYY